MFPCPYLQVNQAVRETSGVLSHRLSHGMNKVMSIAILGWGSLLWDKRPEFAAFEKQHEAWQLDGPSLRLEFSRVSKTRGNGLTLVVENAPNGAVCVVAYALSKRKAWEDAVCDLRDREGTIVANIGFCFADRTKPVRSRESGVLDTIRNWVDARQFEAAVWTDLPTNFAEKSDPRAAFSVSAALAHMKALPSEGKIKTAEYVWRASEFVQTPVRTALQAEPWFVAIKPVPAP